MNKSKITRKSLPSQEYLKSVLDYNPETGVFLWKFRPDIHFPSNVRFSGTPAGTTKLGGYLAININRNHYQAHRLAWVMIYGKEPPTHLDHINGDPSDNRISNIRLANYTENNRNKRCKIGRILPKGVKPNKKRFSARIVVLKKEIHLGTFDTPDEAHSVYMRAAKEHFGEFARFE